MTRTRRSLLALAVALAALPYAPRPAHADHPAAIGVSKTDQLLLPEPISFRVGKSEVAPASDKVLGMVRDYLTAHREVTTLRIEVHSDARGSNRYNLAMSQQRALAVARWLVARGVSCKRLLPVGFGELEPLVSPERTAADRARNRRVDLFRAAIRDKPIAGRALDGGGYLAGDPCKKPMQQAVDSK